MKFSTVKLAVLLILNLTGFPNSFSYKTRKVKNISCGQSYFVGMVFECY